MTKEEFIGMVKREVVELEARFSDIKVAYSKTVKNSPEWKKQRYLYHLVSEKISIFKSLEYLPLFISTVIENMEDYPGNFDFLIEKYRGNYNVHSSYYYIEKVFTEEIDAKNDKTIERYSEIVKVAEDVDNALYLIELIFYCRSLYLIEYSMMEKMNIFNGKEEHRDCWYSLIQGLEKKQNETKEYIKNMVGETAFEELKKQITYEYGSEENTRLQLVLPCEKYYTAELIKRVKEEAKKLYGEEKVLSLTK